MGIRGFNVKSLLPPGLLGLAALGLTAYAVVNRRAMGLVADWKAGDMKRLEVLVPGAWWWGAVIFAVILGGLALTYRWWRGPWRQPEMPARRPVPWWFLATLAGVMILGGVLRAPRMTLSFYNDESYSFRRHVAGAQTPAHGDKPARFRPALWTETCYQNLTGNNSMVFSVLGRLSYDTWRKVTGSAPGTVSEWAVRLPVFLCAVASIGAMGWLGRRVAGPVTGVVVALLTAFHPWHVRYSTEARCYGILMLLMPLLFLALDQARRTGRWRAWLTFGLLEYLTVACFFGAVHFLLGLNLLVAGAALWAWKKSGGFEGKRAALSGIVPLVVSGTLAAGVYLALNLPLFLQTARLVADPTYLHNPFTLDWFQDAGSFLSFGVPGPARLADGGSPVSFGQISEKAPGLAAGLLTGFCGLLLAGGARLIRKGGTGSLVPLASLAGAALTLGYCLYEGLSLLPWYAIFLLPGILLCLAAGVGAMLDLTMDAVGPLPGVLPAIMLMMSWGSVLRVYMTHGREDLRGVVERVRGSREAPMPPPPGSPLLGVFWSEVPVYDRSATVIHVKEELDALMNQAARENRDLYIDSAWRAFVMKDPADRIRVVENEAVFERVAQLPGLDEPGNAHVVWKMKRPPGGGNSLGAAPQIQ